MRCYFSDTTSKRGQREYQLTDIKSLEECFSTVVSTWNCKCFILWARTNIPRNHFWLIVNKASKYLHRFWDLRVFPGRIWGFLHFGLSKKSLNLTFKVSFQYQEPPESFRYLFSYKNINFLNAANFTFESYFGNPNSSIHCTGQIKKLS